MEQILSNIVSPYVMADDNGVFAQDVDFGGLTAVARHSGLSGCSSPCGQSGVRRSVGLFLEKRKSQLTKKRKGPSPNTLPVIERVRMSQGEIYTFQKSLRRSRRDATHYG